MNTEKDEDVAYEEYVQELLWQQHLRRKFMKKVIALFLILSLALYASAEILFPSYETEARCNTDTDCMKHCPPPADDPDCDGGPQ